MSNKDNSVRKVVIATVLGSTLEWYEFSIFAQLSVIIGKLFFPSSNELVSLINTFGIFALGFIIRPVGGLLFGYIGDKYGRKKGLVFSMLLMSIPTFCMGLLPTYNSIGVWAPVLLALCRLMQGLSIGGENGGAYTYVSEYVSANKTGRVVGIIQASVCLGVLLGALSIFAISQSMSQLDFEEKGWRIPFYFSIILGSIGLFIRFYLNETPAYQEIKAKNKISSNPIREILNYPRSIMIAVLLILSMVIPFFTLSVFIQGFMSKILHYPADIVIMCSSVSIFVTMIVSILSGYLSDRFGTRMILKIGAIALLLWAYPLVLLLNNSSNIIYAVVGQQVFAAIIGLYTGSVIAAVVELFPTNIRYTGITLSMNITSSIFGGTVPLFAFWLIGTFGTNNGLLIFASYMAVAAMLSLVAVLSFKKPTIT